MLSSACESSKAAIMCICLSRSMSVFFFVILFHIVEIILTKFSTMVEKLVRKQCVGLSIPHRGASLITIDGITEYKAMKIFKKIGSRQKWELNSSIRILSPFHVASKLL
jgi:hypothetical protein